MGFLVCSLEKLDFPEKGTGDWKPSLETDIGAVRGACVQCLLPCWSLCKYKKGQFCFAGLRMDREPGCRTSEMFMMIYGACGRIHTRPLTRSSHNDWCESNEKV